MRHRIGIGLYVIFLCLEVSCSSEQPSSGVDRKAASGSSEQAKSMELAVPDTQLARKSVVDVQWLIVPGSSAGKIHIDQDAEEVYRLLGKPDDGDAAMQHAVAAWYSNHRPGGHSTAIYTTRDAGNDPVARIRQIRVTSPVFETVEGIHVTSSLKEILAVFALVEGASFEDKGASYKIYECLAGIAFEIGSDDRCTAIVIHKSGSISEGTYLDLRF